MSFIMSPAGLILMTLCVCLSVETATVKDEVEVRSVSGADCTLRCTAKHKPGVQYLAVTWYKVRELPSSPLSGLVTRELPNGTTKTYVGLDREVNLLSDSSSIFLPNVTCGDGGTYSCQLAAPVGEQNSEGQVLLMLRDCSTEDELVTDTYLVICATAVLIVALVIFLISYGSLKNILKERNKVTKKETLMDATLKPLDKKELMLIYTLGPKTSTLKHVVV